MVHTNPIKILYISNECVGKYPCYHFVKLEDSNHSQYKVIMCSIKICELCEKLNYKSNQQHIKNNKNICYFQDNCIIL